MIVDRGIYARNNPYGFIYNVSHPEVNRRYNTYKKEHGLPGHFPISDFERHRFERELTERIVSGEIVVTGREIKR